MHNWKNIYDAVTKICDVGLSFYTIYDVGEFTSAFLSEVPTNWLKYKTMLELISGTLSGDTIDPDVFEAGYDRTTQGWENDVYSNRGSYTGNGESNTTTNSETNDSADVKARSINYQQGVQAYTISNTNIGELGNDYASSMQDNISSSTSDRVNESNQLNNETVNSNTTSNGNNNNTYGETVSERRINYYDNLAFLRERFDRYDAIIPFSDYFKHLFINVTGLGGNW